MTKPEGPADCNNLVMAGLNLISANYFSVVGIMLWNLCCGNFLVSIHLDSFMLRCRLNIVESLFTIG